jgi:hypothetical protein
MDALVCMKNIREIRMGPPKTYKTGAIVTSYPKPMLAFEGDEGGLDVVQQAIQWIHSATDTTNEIETFCKKKREELPPLAAVQFNFKASMSLDELWKPAGDTRTLSQFNKTVNALFLQGCPWKTVVFDPVTVIQELVLASFAQTNASKMDDARKWAGAVGEKTKRIMATLFTLPCHVVIIMHTAKNTVKNPLTGETINETIEPVIYGKIRDFIGSLPSQFFYQDATTVGGTSKVEVMTVSDGRVKGIGCRWPMGLRTKVGPLFDNIYGESVKRGETWM